MKRPSFQFYPADWKNNSKLRRCSEAARGAWVDVLCLLHDSDEYGICRWPLAELARAAGVSVKLARELADKDVLKGADKGSAAYVYTPRHAGKDGTPVTLVAASHTPCWYSSRLVRDEWVRQRRGQSTQFSSDNQPPRPTPDGTPNPAPKPPIGGRQGDGPTSTSTSTIKTNTPIPPEGGNPRPPSKNRKSEAICLQTFLDTCKQKGERPLRDYAPLWQYAQDAGIDSDMIALAWAEFRRRFGAGGTQDRKRYKDWRAAFRKYVENNYFKLWAIDKDGQYFLTSTGKQCQRVHDSREAA